MCKRLFTAFIMLLLSSCTVHYNMFNSYNGYYNKMQIDSICNKEKIPFIDDINWNTMGYFDAEDSVVIKQYVYIRNVVCNKKKSSEETFICTDLDSLYKFNKRILIKEK